MKERLDVLLVKRNLAASREKAKAIIMSGIVYVDGQKEDKAGTTFPEEATIEVRGHTLPYVSRGGLKLEKAMTHFGVQLKDKICMDVGSFYRWIYRLHAAERRGEGIRGRCRAWTAGLEASQRPKSCVHGENQHSLCGTGGYPGEPAFPLLMFPLFP